MKWREEDVDALYRRYRGTRDGIPWERYQPIMQAAREMTFAATAERHIGEILEHARDMYPAQQAEPVDDNRVIEWSGARQRILQRGVGRGMAGRIRKSVRSMTSGLNPAGWVSLAAAAAIVLAVAPVMINLDDPDGGSELVAQQTDVLRSNPAAVSNELGRLGDFQYGFASSGSDFARAFRAGTLFVDLVSLSGDPADPRLKKVVDSVVDGYGEVAGIERPGQIGPETLNGMIDGLQTHYSDSGRSAVFVFGQWVESTYLLSRLSTGGNEEALLKALEDASAVRDLLDSGGFLDSAIAADLAALEKMGSSGGLDADGIERVSLLLLKLRTRYAQS